MAVEFNRIITLLRKERGLTQKQAAQDLGISQAQLSHYEKGIRECGLEFVVQVANYYGVSCDYLLGRSAERSGQTITVDQLPDTAAHGDSVYRGSVLPVMYKKLIENSLDILFDRLAACKDKGLVAAVSNYLMLAVYRVFRQLYQASPKMWPACSASAGPAGKAIPTPPCMWPKPTCRRPWPARAAPRSPARWRRWT